MEELATIALCCLSVWIAAFELLRPSAHEASGAIRGARARRRVSHLLSTLGETPLPAFLQTIPRWRRTCDALSKTPLARAFELGCAECGAALLVGDVLLAIALCVMASSVLGVGFAVAALVVGVPLLDESRMRRRRAELSREMPEVFRTLAMALGSGETLPQAIDYLGGHGRGVVAEAFGRTSLRLRCGEGAADALADLSGELDAPGMRLLTTALTIAQRTGSPLRGLFLHSARLVERQGDLERLLTVKTAQVRLSVRMVCAMPVVMVGLLALLSPDYRQGLASVAGVGSILVALAMDAAALAIVRRLMKGVL